MTERWKARLQADQRLLSIFKGSATGVLARTASMLAGIITLPLTLRYLGLEEYGIWVTVTGTVVMLNLLDLGIASTLTNFLSQAFADDDRTSARRFYSTAFWLTVAVTIVLAMVLAMLWSFMDWARLLHIAATGTLHEAERAIIVAVVASLLNLPLNLVGKVGGAYRELHVVNYFSILGSVLSLSGVVLGVTLHVRFSTLMLLYCAGPVLANLCVNAWMILYRRPWLLPLPWLSSRSEAQDLFKQGSLFFVLQLCGVVVFNSDNLVITHYLGAQQVTPYSVAWRLAN